jgi:hypothetical protein
MPDLTYHREFSFSVNPQLKKYWPMQIKWVVPKKTFGTVLTLSGKIGHVVLTFNSRFPQCCRYIA